MTDDETLKRAEALKTAVLRRLLNNVERREAKDCFALLNAAEQLAHAIVVMRHRSAKQVRVEYYGEPAETRESIEAFFPGVVFEKAERLLQ